MWNLSTDTGGTFTDLIALDEAGRIVVAKTPSTPPDFETGVADAIRQSGIAPHDINLFYHGTTVTTNALLTRTGARTALLATRGFRDVLEIRDGQRQELYDVAWNPPPPLIPRVDRLEVTERVAYDGRIVVALDEADVRSAARTLRRRGVEAVAVCLIHAYANPAHEEAIRAILLEELPGTYLSISSEVMPEPPEYERTTTTVANAYVGPVLTRYVDRLEGAVRALGLGCGVLIMHSGGGTMTPAAASRLAIRTATSGPAGGVLAAEAIARAIGRRDVVSVDVGGTSADIATIEGGRPRMTVDQVLEWGLPLRFPSIDVVAIGAGGGSIAWIDEAGVPHAGPQSAGARPGPACYGQGGREPTTTDAAVVLGLIRPDHFLGGRIALDRQRAVEAVRTRFAEPLGLDVEAAAAGILRIANTNMANAIRGQTVARGLDLRGFSLIAFGGAGPLFGAAIAGELQMREVVVPPHPGATSALGLLFADARHDAVRSLVAPVAEIDPSEVEALFAQMRAQAEALLRADGFAHSDMRFERQIELRYLSQVRAIPITLASGPIGRAEIDDAASRFHAAYEVEFHFAIPEFPVEARNLRLVATGLVRKPQFERSHDRQSGEPRASATAPVWFAGESVTTRYYDRAALLPDARIVGPAIVEQFDSTTVVPPGARLEVDDMRNLLLTL